MRTRLTSLAFPPVVAALFATGLATAVPAEPARAGLALGDVQVEVRGTARVRGSLRPRGETEMVLAALPGGATADLDVVARSVGLGPTAQLTLDKVPVEPGQVLFRTLRRTDRGVALRGLEVAESATLAVVLGASGVGDYDLSLRTRPKLRWRVTEDFSPQPAQPPAFSAPLGAGAVLTARPAKGSSAVPVIASVDSADTRDVGRRTDRLHTIRLAAADLAARMDHFVTLEDASGLGGAIQLDVVVQTRGVPADRLDLRGAAAGLPRGGEVALGRIVATDDVSEVSSRWNLGMAWEQPNFPRPVRILLTTSSVRPDEIPSGWTAVSDVWRYDTEGEHSGRGVELLLPLPLGLARASRETRVEDLKVLFLPDGDEPVLEEAEDRDTYRIRQWKTRPGRLVIVAPEGPGRVHGSSYWTVSAAAGLRGDSSRDSRDRQANFAAGRIDYGPDPAAGTCPLVQRLTTVDLDLTPRSGAAPVTSSSFVSIPHATWRYDTEEPGGILAGNGWRYAVSAGGAYLVSVASDVGEFAAVGIDLQVRRDFQLRGLDQVSGTWDVLAFTIAAEPADGRIEVGVGRAVGVLTIEDDGGWRLAAKVADVFHDGSGVHASKAQRTEVRGTARLVDAGDPLAGGFELVFDAPDGGGESSLLCLPGAGGRALVGRGAFGPHDEAVFVALWRTPQLARLGGTWAAGSFELGIADIDLDSASVGDWEVGAESGTCDLDGPPPAPLGLDLPYRPFARRDPSADGGVAVESRAASSREGSWRQNLRDGAIELRDDGRVLAARADESGELIVFVDAPTARVESLVLGALVRR